MRIRFATFELKILFNLAILCLTIVLSTKFVSAQGILQIPYTPKELNPGKIQDQDSYGNPIEFEVHKTDSSGSANQVNIYFAWDEIYLYGKAIVQDDELINLRKGQDHPNLNLNDALEFFIDPFSDSKGRMDINDYQVIFSVGNDFAILKGDKTKMAIPDNRAPKEIGIATMAIMHQTFIMGTINQVNDTDSGYQVQFAIPWAAMGVIPKANHSFKMDICLDDMDKILLLDTMNEESHLEAFSYANWVGDKDFSYPDRWRKAVLTGSPGQIDMFLKHSTNKAVIWILCFILGTALVIGIQSRRIRQLRKVPVKKEIEQSAVVHFVDHKVDSSSVVIDPIFEELRNYILERLDQDVSPIEMARHANVSIRQLQRIFQEQMDSTPSRFVLLIKLEKASELLRNPGSNISQVAYGLGFNDAAYFSRVFKKYHGIAPTAFKEMIAE